MFGFAILMHDRQSYILVIAGLIAGIEAWYLERKQAQHEKVKPNPIRGLNE